MVELVTFLAGLHHSRFRSLSAVPLLQTTDPFCISAAISRCLQVTVNFGGKSLHAVIFKRLFIQLKPKGRLPASLYNRIIWGERVEILKTWLARALESSTCSPALSTRGSTRYPPTLTSLWFHVWFLSWPLCVGITPYTELYDRSWRPCWCQSN